MKEKDQNLFNGKTSIIYSPIGNGKSSFKAIVELASFEIMKRIEMEEKLENTTCENLQTRQKRST